MNGSEDSLAERIKSATNARDSINGVSSSIVSQNSKRLEKTSTSTVPNPPPPTPVVDSVLHLQTKTVELIEEFYGTYIDTKGCQHKIKKFTWKNYNKISVSIINYGARIVSIKIPDKKGKLVDVLLGFDELSGHVKHANHPLGACLGRCAGVIKDGSFRIDRSLSNLTKNAGEHHKNGGYRGFDKVVWTPYVDNSRVILTYVSADKDEGYPGNLFVKLTFELCNRNQFNVDYEAHCSEPTVVNLTHKCYFNLAGSNQGPVEIYHHLLTLNSNCYTVQDDQNKMPTGEIKNVVNSKHDFQIPKCLSNVLGVKPGDGYDQNYCVNRGTSQKECFVSRLFHPPSGRMVEIYSSHKGVVLTTGNEFGTGAPMPIEQLLDKPNTTCSTTSLVVEHIYRNLKELLKLDKGDKDYFEMRDLIDLIKGVQLGDKENLDKIELTKRQRQYLEKIYHYCGTCEGKIAKCEKILDAVQMILSNAAPPEISDHDDDVLFAPQEGSADTGDSELRARIRSQLSKITGLVDNDDDYGDRKTRLPKKIVGKGDYWYKAHCGVAVTPGAYPNAINVEAFPDTTLRPSEVYRETTSFRFWVRAGNPNNWIKRKNFEFTYDAKQAAKLEEQEKAADILAMGLK